MAARDPRHLFHRSGLRTALALLILWEVIGQLDLVAGGALPAPSAILMRLWIDGADYPRHVLATLYASAAGFVIGNLAGVLAGVIFALSPAMLRLFRGVNIAVFALPPIAIAPILALTLSGMAPRITLAALGVYFVTMSATVIGLSQADSRATDLIRAYGGNRRQQLRLVSFRGALPSILAGLRIAAPNAVLGAILAEFGGGGRWGLGAYLLGSLGRGEPERLWGIGLIATAIAGLSYAGFALLAGRLIGASRAVTMNAALPDAPTEKEHPLLAVALRAGMIALPFALWWMFIWGTGVPALIAKTPLGVVDYLFFSPASASARSRLLEAMGQTLPVTALGMVAGLGFAFLLAISSRLFPRAIRAFMPVALVTQTMPLVALTPLLVLVLGRGMSLTLWVTISVTFFPAFVTLAQGIALVPRSAQDVPRAYGASAWTEMRLVTIPASLPYLFAATRLTVPRALLGVMIAEWLATGKGLGNLLNQSRGFMDYGMIWTVAAVSVLLSVVFYQLVVVAERRVLRRLGMQTAE
ncbi:ABC transporter permease subunit [Pseudooceanicola sediminis]|uniref:ABC transporter permease subunit n=2 Tax=Pseudooceanicola sediminis TaxID=2211117 RepID=A0A399J395_9RHOB|nr:ABC transporter permease subunit [Pseudooceanicola sediminis]KAA2314245.1 ABC transporter permease subunit [Puniceibacterium sp. HSS470]RII39898.1 ABC transporter permease subunit [Pseudooceanicola sediminis]|tara:strand:- start:49484 stop:51064 length:1581 start_codon:yes stop_codon:yes gene_type:complete